MRIHVNRFTLRMEIVTSLFVQALDVCLLKKQLFRKTKSFSSLFSCSIFTPSFSTIMQILKLLDNEDMDPSALDGIKDDIDYYIEVQHELLLFPSSQHLPIFIYFNPLI